MSCNKPDVTFPMYADLYHAVVQQSAYGNISRQWVLDRTVVGNFIPAGSEIKEELVINVDLTQDSLLIARVKCDLRIDSDDENYALTNILITNIRDRKGKPIYKETSGPRAGESTLYEIATQQPFVNPFGRVEHNRVILRRSENQAENV